jgi:hypothetical protein
MAAQLSVLGVDYSVGEGWAEAGTASPPEGRVGNADDGCIVLSASEIGVFQLVHSPRTKKMPSHAHPFLGALFLLV